jgi:NTP pyrophosphatase (non-canonical NTP hydrolase)
VKIKEFSRDGRKIAGESIIMTEQEIEQNIQKIADYYGLDNQLNKTIEECAELIQALVKLESRENTIEEIADVQIMLKQMLYLLDCEEEVEKVMEYKINRQLERIRQAKEQ